MKHQHKEIKVLHRFLKQHKIGRKDYDLKKKLIGYEGFPSLASLVDFFRLEKIDFSIFQFLETEDLPSAFLTYLKSEDEVFLAFVQKKGMQFSADVGEGKMTFSATAIKELMTDYFIVVEQGSSLNYYLKMVFGDWEEKVLLFFLLGVILMSISKSDGSSVVIALLALVGGITSLIFILKKKGNLMVQNICTSNQVDTCKKIQDKKLLQVFDIAVLSSSYFLTLVLFLCLNSSNLYSDLYFFAILSLIAVVFSVYYQVFKMKSICLLCSIINGTLIALFFYLFKVSGNHASFNMEFLLILIVLYAILHLVYAKSQERKEALHWRQYLNSFQSNPGIFSFYLERSRKIITTTVDFSQENSIVFIINPDCNSCKDLMKEFKNSIMNSTLDIKIKYNLFYDSSDIEYTKASVLVKLYNENKTAFFNYIEGETSVATSYKITENEQKKIDQLLKDDLDWCKSNQIIGAPAMVINGVLFPIHKYEFNYLRLLIEDYFEEDY